jgi:hypothetical protein
MMFERHGLKVVGYSAIAPEDIAMFFQNYGIENNETYKELQKQRKELQKNSYKNKEKRVGMANIT